MQARNEDLGVGEALAVLCAIGVVAVAIVATYARESPSELYNVSIEGLPGGLSRAVVFLNFPAALIAIPIAVIAAGRIGSRAAWVVAAIAVGLSAVIVLGTPIVDQSDLDVRLVNAVPAAGVLLAAGLTVEARRRAGGGFAPRRRSDALRLIAAIVLVVVAVPWIAADLGVSFDGVPILGSLWQTGEFRLQPGHTTPAPAVHHGHHHGMDGVLLAITALALSRMRVTQLRIAVELYLALMLAYGLANAVQDGWLEQVVKRGWTTRQIPSLLNPQISLGWGAIVGAAILVWLGSTAVTRTARRPNR